MLGSFIRHGLTQRQCETEAIFQVVAGSDTTATAIRSTLLYIITTPHVYQALLREIDEANLSTPIKGAEGETLPYLQAGLQHVGISAQGAYLVLIGLHQAVIFEGLRIHPPFTGIPFKEVPPQGDTLNGKFVPGGTRIAPSLWSLSRNKAVFGDDSELFRPERWLEADVKKRTDMRQTVELVFGYGRWACAGKTIAFLELNKVFVEVSTHLQTKTCLNQP